MHTSLSNLYSRGGSVAFVVLAGGGGLVAGVVVAGGSGVGAVKYIPLPYFPYHSWDYPS